METNLLFSSIASVWSPAGAAHYAAANSYLDCIAEWLQRVGMPATAVNFGPFGTLGMVAQFGCDEQNQIKYLVKFAGHEKTESARTSWAGLMDSCALCSFRTHVLQNRNEGSWLGPA